MLCQNIVFMHLGGLAAQIRILITALEHIEAILSRKGLMR